MRAHVRAFFGKASGAARSLPLTAVDPVIDDQGAAQAASVTSTIISCDATRPDAVGRKDVLLNGTAHRRADLSWYRPAHVQLLSAPDGESDSPSWSALVVDGVAVPYNEVVRVRMDESALEFIVEYSPTAQCPYRVAHTPHSPTGEDESLRQHLRMSTCSEFNLWREALYPKIARQSTSGESKPSPIYAAQKWLEHAESAAALHGPTLKYADPRQA